MKARTITLRVSDVEKYLKRLQPCKGCGAVECEFGHELQKLVDTAKGKK